MHYHYAILNSITKDVIWEVKELGLVNTLRLAKLNPEKQPLLLCTIEIESIGNGEEYASYYTLRNQQHIRTVKRKSSDTEGYLLHWTIAGEWFNRRHLVNDPRSSSISSLTLDRIWAKHPRMVKRGGSYYYGKVCIAKPLQG